MVVPTDLQVRLERFAARELPLRACTVSTGVERCQRKCTPARFVAESGTLESCRSFLPEPTLEPKLRVRSRAGDGRRGRCRGAGRAGGARRRRLLVRGLVGRPPRATGGGAPPGDVSSWSAGCSGGGSRPPAAGRSGRRRSRYVAPADVGSASTVAAAA